MDSRPRDRLSRLIWSILDEAPDTFVGDPVVDVNARDLLLIAAYIERLESQIGIVDRIAVEGDRQPEAKEPG